MTELVEIRPVRPEDKPNAHESATLRDWRLTADPASGTLTLAGDKTVFGKGEPRVFSLPSSGRPGAVTTVCLVAYHWHMDKQDGATWRMLFLDGTGQVAGASVPRNYPRVLRLFPPEVFGPLAALGIRVVSETYDSPQALEQAHYGGADTMAKIGTSQRKSAALGLGLAVIIVLVALVIVLLTGH
jgi:hypothetical protein